MKSSKMNKRGMHQKRLGTTGLDTLLLVFLSN